MGISAGNAHAAWSTDPTVNNAISTAAGDQYGPTIVSDGSGGAIITWYDYRSGTSYDIYAQSVATLLGHTISGKVVRKAFSRAPVSGVTVNLTGKASKTTTTDSNGNYSFTGLVNGAYTITPKKRGWLFIPASRSVNLKSADVAWQDFLMKYW